MKNKLPTTWDLSDLGKKYNDPAFKKERENATKNIKKFARKWKKDQSYLTNAESLKKALDQSNKLSEESDREGMYLFLMRQIDSGNTKLIATEKKYIEYAQELADETRFFGLSLGKIESKYQKIFLKDKSLKIYRHFLEGIFETAKYQLSEAEERILSLKSGVSHGNWSSMVSEIFAHESAEVLTKGKGSARPKQMKTFNEIVALLQSDCKRVRNSAVKAITETFEKHSFVVEKELNSVLENKKINDDLRGFKRADEARIIADDINIKIVDTMSGVVTDFFSISRDFYKLKAQLLKQDKLHYHERNVPVFKNKTEYSYEKSVAIVDEAFEKIDSDFVNIFRSMTSEGKLDVFPRPGKRGGAFCMYHGKKEPVYVMLNHTNKANDVMTIAHEMGHAIHGTLAKREIAINYDTPMFMAEIASTFCEGYTFDSLVEKASDKEKLTLMIDNVGDAVSTIMRQIAAYNFEKELHKTFHERGYLAKEDIGKIFKKHMSAYMGPAVLQDHDAENWWMYWSHFRSPFYVYSYASGLLLANGMRAIVSKDKERWKDIKKFFYTGTSKSPQQVFKEMGIDITDEEFWKSGMNEIKILLKETKKLAKKLGKI